MKRDEARIFLETDVDAVRENFARIKKRALAAVKANAYEPMAETLSVAGADGFGVATLEEALAVKKYGLPVQILGGVLDSEREDAVANGLILGLTDLDCAAKISAEAVECHFKIDAGMGRLGILARDAKKVIGRILTLPNLDCSGIYSHFSVSENGGDAANLAQTERFLSVVAEAEALGTNFRKIHLANSDAINVSPRACQPPFTHVRAGIDLHWSFPPAAAGLGLRSVLTVKSRLLARRLMSAGHGIGYDSICRLEQDVCVGTITGGCADGLPLGMSDRGPVVIQGRVCPALGRISMDCTTVSLAAFGDDPPPPGTAVTLIGNDGASPVTGEDWAKWKGAHAYGVLCSFGPRVKRFYTGKQQPNQK